MINRYSCFYPILLLLFLFSCQSPVEIDDNESGRLLLRLTDAPFPHSLVNQVDITISQVRLVPISKEADPDKSDSELELMKNAYSVNLLELTNGVTITLANKEMPVGYYGGIELFVRDSRISLSDQTEIDLNIGSHQNSAYKIFVPLSFSIENGLTTDLLVDFDVSRSFIPRYIKDSKTEIADFLFNPFVKMSDANKSGSISGIVTTSLHNKISRVNGAQVTVMAADTVNTTTFTDVSGMYTILGLTPGTYDLLVDLEGHDARLVRNVSVEANVDTKQGILFTQSY